MDASVLGASNFLIYLRDLCAEEEKLLVLLGTPEELESAEKALPPTLISACFKRPFDIKSLVDEMDALVQVNEENAHRKNILLVDDDSTFLKTIKG